MSEGTVGWVEENTRQFASGTVATKQPRLSLIPYKGLVNAALRFELGLERHKEKAWNNLAKNQSALVDTDFLIERCSHAIAHLYSLIDYLTHKSKDVELAKGDAGA